MNGSLPRSEEGRHQTEEGDERPQGIAQEAGRHAPTRPSGDRAPRPSDEPRKPGPAPRDPTAPRPSAPPQRRTGSQPAHRQYSAPPNSPDSGGNSPRTWHVIPGFGAGNDCSEVTGSTTVSPVAHLVSMTVPLRVPTPSPPLASPSHALALPA
jgi:hypothetical protein